MTDRPDREALAAKLELYAVGGMVADFDDVLYDAAAALRAPAVAEVRIETECPACGVELLVCGHEDGGSMVMTMAPLTTDQSTGTEGDNNG
jgi:hypothetical protein